MSVTFIAGSAAGAQGKFSPDPLTRQVSSCHTLASRRPPDHFPSYRTQLNEFNGLQSQRSPISETQETLSVVNGGSLKVSGRLQAGILRPSPTLRPPRPPPPPPHSRKDQVDRCVSSVTTDATSGRESRRGNFPRARTWSKRRDYSNCYTRSPSFPAPQYPNPRPEGGKPRAARA